MFSKARSIYGRADSTYRETRKIFGSGRGASSGRIHARTRTLSSLSGRLQALH